MNANTNWIKMLESIGVESFDVANFNLLNLFYFIIGYCSDKYWIVAIYLRM